MAPESHDEVRQRIDFLYDQAENVTGRFNATRAMARRTRSRDVPPAERPGPRREPALDALTRQRFDTARAALGPTVPAVLPIGRRPDRTPAAPFLQESGAVSEGGPASLEAGPSAGTVRRLERGAGETAGALAPAVPGTLLGALSTGGAVASLPAGSAEAAPSAEGGRGAAAAGGPITGPLEGPVTIPSAGSASAVVGPAGVRAVRSPARDVLAAPVSEPVAAGGPAGLGERGAVGGASVETVVLPDAVGPSAAQGSRARGPRPLPGAGGSGRLSPAVAKATGRHKLALAGGLLTRHTTEPPVPDEAVQPAPAPDFPSTATGTGPGTGTLPHPMSSAPLTSAAAPHLAPPEPAPHTGAVPRPAPRASGSDTGATPYPVPSAPLANATSAADTRATADQAAPPHTTETGTTPHPASSAPLTPATPYPAPPAPSPHPGAAPAPAVPGGAQVHGPVAPLTATASSPPESPRALRAARAVAFARAQVGKPCVSGATGPGSYDCAGLTQAAWREAGVALPRAAHAQALAGTPVTADAMEPGDLVVFFDDGRHVGLHTGGGMMVHAPGPGSVIREEPVYGAGETAIRRVVRPA